MLSTTLIACIGAAGAALVAARLIWKRRRSSAQAEAEIAGIRNAASASMLFSVAASVGLARSQADPDSHGWHGSHLDHGGYGGSFSNVGGGHGGEGGGGGI